MTTKKTILAVLLSVGFCIAGRAFASDIKGRALLGNAPIAKSTVTLWEASAGAPKQLSQTKTGDDGRFEIRTNGAHGDAVLYLVASGGEAKAKPGSSDNPGLVLMTILQSDAPANVTINELTTVASAFTAARFINGQAISGNPLGLHIAAGNAPNLVDPATGGWGKVVLDPLNSTQTTTLASLDTLGSLITAFVTVADDNWRARFFKASTPSGGAAPTNTLQAMAGIAREPWADPTDLYALFSEAYPQPKDGARRAAPFVPYLALVPADFSLSLASPAAESILPAESCSMRKANVERPKLDGRFTVRSRPKHRRRLVRTHSQRHTPLPADRRFHRDGH